MKLDCKCIVNFGEIKDQSGQIVYNIEADKAAVQAAVDTNYSNALLEGTVNRVKTIKRTMFNKAG